MDVNEIYEVKAEAFRIMTGYMAPGKDAAPESYSATYEDRFDTYRDWLEQYGECANAMILAFNRIIIR